MKPMPTDARWVKLHAVPSTLPLTWTTPMTLLQTAAMAKGAESATFPAVGAIPKYHDIGHGFATTNCWGTTEKRLLKNARTDEAMISQTGDDDSAVIAHMAGALLYNINGYLEEDRIGPRNERFAELEARRIAGKYDVNGKITYGPLSIPLPSRWVRKTKANVPVPVKPVAPAFGAPAQVWAAYWAALAAYPGLVTAYNASLAAIDQIANAMNQAFKLIELASGADYDFNVNLQTDALELRFTPALMKVKGQTALGEATLFVSDEQCAAIRAWYDEYRTPRIFNLPLGGIAALEPYRRYSGANAPWLLEGGGCGSVAVTAALWASGYNKFKLAASSAVKQLDIGAGRLLGDVDTGIYTIPALPSPTFHNGWYPYGSMMQNATTVWPAGIDVGGLPFTYRYLWSPGLMGAWSGPYVDLPVAPFTIPFVGVVNVPAAVAPVTDPVLTSAAPATPTTVPLSIVDPSLIVQAIGGAWTAAGKGADRPALGNAAALWGETWYAAYEDRNTYRHPHMWIDIRGATGRAVAKKNGKVEITSATRNLF